MWIRTTPSTAPAACVAPRRAVTLPARRPLPTEPPDDMRLPDGMQHATLDQQIDAARVEVHRWRNAMEHRTRLQYGHGSMHPTTYAAGLQARLSIFHTLWRQRHTAAPRNLP